MNRISKLFALCAALLVSVSMSADELELTSYVAPEWNDYEFTLSSDDDCWKINSSNTNRPYINSSKYKNVLSTSLDAHVTVDCDATLRFKSQSSANYNMIVLVDGVEVASYQKKDLKYEKLHFIELEQGTHTVTWQMAIASGDYITPLLYDIGVERTPTIHVNLLKPGSLGTEVLYHVDRLQDVRKLKVTGEMNNEDMEKLSLMKDNICMIDLSEAQLPNGEIQANAFEGAQWLHTAVLPEGLKTIGNYAFKGSVIENINFPNSLESLGGYCFQSTYIKEAIFGDNCVFDGGYQFHSCYYLHKIVLPKNMKKITQYAFSNCIDFCDIPLPDKLEELGFMAFYNCNANANENNNLVIPESCTNIRERAFQNSVFNVVTFPASLYIYNKYSSSTDYSLFNSSSVVNKIILQGPSVVYVPYKNFMSSASCANTILEVPDFLVNYYKQDNFWYQFKEIRGYETAGVREWIIRGDLILDSHNRWSDEPNTTLKETGSFETYGTDPLVLGDFTVENNLSTGSYGRVMSFIDNFTVNGTLSVNEYMAKNKWYYISLPFNMKAGDITFLGGTAQKAIRYYNGANRAENGTGNNWVNCTAETIIPAGTGFIFQPSADGYWNFPAQNDESKSYMTDYKMFVKLLEANPSEVVSNSGWNLVGNPYQAWYNIHKLNFTAPITVRNVSTNNYEAYSIIDDDYALAPSQAFFVQCPEGTTEISFPLNGRQMTSEITSQNGAPAKNPQISRVLVDLALNNGDNADRTRVVLNQKASLEYETSCDASKFLSESNVAQLYTLDADGTMYAINERPVMDGEINLGVIIPENGTYSFSLLRNMADNVYVRDNATGETVEITNDNYEFYAEAGTHDNRFAVVIESNVATGIKNVGQDSSLDTQNCYNLAGQKVGVGYKGIVIKNGKKAIVK